MRPLEILHEAPHQRQGCGRLGWPVDQLAGRGDAGGLLPHSVGHLLVIVGISIPDSAVKAEADRYNIGTMQAYRRIQAREYLKQRLADRRRYSTAGVLK